MHIRNTLNREDLPLMYEIELECFTRGFQWGRKVFSEMLLSASKKNNVWVAEEDGKIVGFLLANERGNKGQIETVDVPAAYRRRGIASKLIKFCEMEFQKRGRTEVTLEVHTENPAQLLYFSLGYRVTGFRRHYYGLHCHALTMTKKLDGSRLCAHPTCTTCAAKSVL